MTDSPPEEYRFVCTNDGHVFGVPSTHEQRAGKKQVLCPKCSQRAVPWNFFGAANSLPNIFRMIRELKDRVFELECEAEARANPAENPDR